MSLLEDVKKIKKKYSNFIMTIPGVAGIGVGGPINEPYICIYVEKDVESIKAVLAKEIDGVKVVIEKSGKIVAH
jgi:hypothetical protein